MPWGRVFVFSIAVFVSLSATASGGEAPQTPSAPIDPLAGRWAADSNQANAYFGASVASAGDVNGDGYTDVIVGAPNYDHGQSDEGRAFVYYGSPAGLSATPNWTAESNEANAEFGYSVASAGDLNGDGYDDVIVGAPNYDHGQSDEGRAFAYFGSPSGPSLTPNWTAESNQATAYFGSSVGTAGDVNGDGYDDVIVGAKFYSNGQIGEGRAFAYHGSPNGLSATPNWTAESNQANAYLGTSVGTAGDVNGMATRTRSSAPSSTATARVARVGPSSTRDLHLG